MVEFAKLKAWKQTQERRYRLINNQESAARLVQIRQMIGDMFTMEEINTLMFDLNIDHEEVRGETKPDKARELVAYCDRRGLIDTLIQLCQAERPHAPWPVL